MDLPEKTPVFDVLPRDVIQKLMDDIYDAVGLQVTMVDCHGERIARADRQEIRCVPSPDIPDFEARCAACRTEVERRSREKDGVYIYRCWRGLMSALAPIRVDGQYLGRLEISVFVSSPESMALAEQINPEPRYALSETERKQYPFLYRERVSDTISIIRIAAGYLTELYRRQRAEQLQSLAEFKALQSQIRPHFLFNTLNSISQLALLEGAEQTPEAIYSLAGILRRTMKQHTQMIPLTEELQLVSDYVRIKQLTGRETLQYSAEIEEGIDRMLLPPLCVQPLVENAITHSLEANQQGGHVRFTAHRSETHVILSVTDDGIGFDPNHAQPGNNGEMSGIGLSNVTTRLENFFGAGFHYKIRSAPGRGTTVSLCIPRDKAGV